MTPSPREARLNRLRITICAVLIVLTAAQYLLILVEVPAFVRRVADREVPTFVIGGASDVSNEIMADRAERRGLSLAGYAVYYLLVGFGTALGFWVAGALVLWKHGDDWYRWLTALALIFFPSGSLYLVLNVTQPVLARYVDVLALIWPLFFVFLYLFPNGRAVPRWSRWPMALLAAGHFAAQLAGFLLALPGQPVPLPAGTLEAFQLVITIEFVLLLICQIYRYLRVSGPVERRQIQWFVAAVVGVVVLSSLLEFLTGGQTAAGDAGYASDLSNGLLLLVPVAITISILRYRLWDIDVIIRRTLIYTLLTAVLALVYLGSVVVLQGIFSAFTGESGNQLVVVISTLGIAALFVPLRGRVQRVIDQRFYRKKYDAARTLAAFGAHARDVVELEQLKRQLVNVVEEAIQPAHVSVWVRGAPVRGEKV
jgi:hypothetical protein